MYPPGARGSIPLWHFPLFITERSGAARGGSGRSGGLYDAAEEAEPAAGMLEKGLACEGGPSAPRPVAHVASLGPLRALPGKDVVGAREEGRHDLGLRLQRIGGPRVRGVEGEQGFGGNRGQVRFGRRGQEGE